MASAEPELCVLIVNWRGGETLTRCIESLLDSCSPPSNIIVVDNASPDLSHIEAKRRFPSIHLLEMGDNSGFARANNVGASYFLESLSDELLLLLNNDAFVRPGCLRALCQAARDHRQFTMFSPMIYYADEPDRIWYAGGEMAWREGSVRFGRLHLQIDRGQLTSAIETEFASGCALMMRREGIQDRQLFDERYYMYDEDVDLSLRVREAGGRILLVPSAKVDHQVGGSLARTGKDSQRPSLFSVTSPAALFVYYHAARNRVWTMKKHGSFLQRVLFWAWMIPLWCWRSARFAAAGRPEGVHAIAQGVFDALSGRFEDRHDEWRVSAAREVVIEQA